MFKMDKLDKDCVGELARYHMISDAQMTDEILEVCSIFVEIEFNTSWIFSGGMTMSLLPIFSYFNKSTKAGTQRSYLLQGTTHCSHDMMLRVCYSVYV